METLQNLHSPSCFHMIQTAFLYIFINYFIFVIWRGVFQSLVKHLGWSLSTKTRLTVFAKGSILGV